jgi:hypothetical protein
VNDSHGGPGSGGWLVALASPASAEVSLGPAVVSAASVLLVALGGLPVGHRQFERADLG